MADFNGIPSTGSMGAMIAGMYSSVRVEDCTDCIKDSEEYKKGYDDFMKTKQLSEYTYGQLNARKALGMSGTDMAEAAMDHMIFGIDPMKSLVYKKFGMLP